MILLVLVAPLSSFALSAPPLPERHQFRRLRKAYGSAQALGGGVAPGFSGTAGSPKGLPRLRFDRLHIVGGASLVSLVDDMTKSA